MLAIRALLLLALAAGASLALGQAAAPPDKRPEPRVDRPYAGAPQVPAFSLFGPPAFWKKFHGGPPKLVPGAWVEYQIEQAHANPSMVRISVIPESGLPSPRHRVLELRQAAPTGERTYVKMLLSKSLSEERNIEALQVKAPGLPVLNFPMGGDDAVADTEITGNLRAMKNATVKDLGQETVTTPAGTFETHHYLVRPPKGTPGPAMELWLDQSGAVPLYRIVKAKKGDDVSVLLGHGTDARTDLPPIAPSVPRRGHAHE